MSQIVQFVETRERKFRMPSTDRYEFKPQGRWARAMQQARDFWCEYRSGNRIMGLKVRIIPWMRGVIVMPRER